MIADRLLFSDDETEVFLTGKIVSANRDRAASFRVRGGGMGGLKKTA